LRSRLKAWRSQIGSWLIFVADFSEEYKVL